MDSKSTAASLGLAEPCATVADKAEPTIFRVIVTAPFVVRIGGARPEVKLFVDMESKFVVAYHAWDSDHVMRFDDFADAREFFGRLTEYPAPNRIRRRRPVLRAGRRPA